MRDIINEILKGKNIQSNLLKYPLGIMELNHKYAYVRLALIYYTYYQMVEELEENTLHKNIGADIHKVIKEAVLNDSMKVQEAISLLEQDRTLLMDEVTALTYYVDAFAVFEHALNRVEYRFKDDTLPKEYNDEEMCRMIMQYILADEDNAVINSKIAEVIAQLPIRMTKSKFFEMVENGLSIYKGNDRQTLKDFLYMIRTSAMIHNEKNYADVLPELEETLKEFKKTDFSKIEEEQYKMLAKSIGDVSEYIDTVMNIALILQELVNDAYILLLTKEQTSENEQIKSCITIVKGVNDFFTDNLNISDEIETLFVTLEGTQETLYSKIMTYNILDEIMQTYQEKIKKNNLMQNYEILDKLAKLSSDSIFVELEEEYDSTIVDEVILQEEKTQVIGEFKALFDSNSKNINRAVMATTLAGLPVFFNNISELQDFIYQTLSNCMDKAEKRACIEILHQIMEE